MRVPPGPRGFKALGFFGGGSGAGVLEFLARTARAYGPISSFRILHKRIYLVDDAGLVREMLVTRQHEFARDAGATLLRELVGDGLITREEPRHRERRRVLQPAFHREQIAEYARSMTAEVERFASELRQDSEIDIRGAMRRLTLSIVGSALFGADFHQSAGQVAQVLERVGRRSRWLGTAIALIEPLVLAYRRLFPGAPSLFFARERAELERIIAPVVEQRRERQGKDILSLILNERNEDNSRLSEEEVRNEVVTFVLAGHETTATALTWAWYLLSRHTEARERMQQEVDQVLGDRAPQLEDVPQLRFTSMIFQEALRLYPPALAFARRPKQKLTLGGYSIPRGTSIFLSPYITQRNPRYFDHPDEFRPERWETSSPPKFAYFPFGGGAKMCIGEPFAKLEGVLVLASLARNWQFEWLGDKEATPGLGLLANPDQAVRMRVRSRTDRPHRSLAVTAQKALAD
ncbi:MAG TPA: cytochrome P450 [Bryobacteraceae bacterium]|jgi:cytochrome P450|nr:cytochrome P450 [Bryobacteraceae bacterium]